MDSLGQFEQIVLTAILALDDNAYGVTIHAKVEELSRPKKAARGAVYATLDRMEDKGLISSWLSEPTKERGGRSRRHYRIEKSGEKALRESARTAQRLVETIAQTLGGIGMEAALNGPPEWLERMVLLAIPPAARESVAGDLWETCQNPHQYAAEALRTVPFVILSQMRRNLNPLALTLQGVLIFLLLGGPVTLFALPLLMLRDAYQPIARPSPRRAIREAVLLSSCAMVLLFLFMSLHPPFPVRAGVDSFTWLSLFLAALFLSPFLCMFRAGLIMQGDRRTPLAADALSQDALEGAYRTFLRNAFCRNMLEGIALAFAAVAGFFFAWNALWIGLFVLAAIYLLLDTVPQPAGDFAALRAQYQRQLLRQEQLHRFLRWLWFAPVLVALQARLAATAATTQDSLTVLLNCVAVAILCFLVTALNREHGGRVQEQIGFLDRMRES